VAKLLVSVAVGLALVALTSSWLASRQFAVDAGLSQVHIGNALLGRQPATLTGAGWLVCTSVAALAVYAALSAVQTLTRPGASPPPDNTPPLRPTSRPATGSRAFVLGFLLTLWGLGLAVVLAIVVLGIVA
jgi:hypothetical protein